MLDLDDNAVRDAVVANPSLAVCEHTPGCLDEYQRAPGVLDAIKARLNAEGTPPGTAILTGSTRHDVLPRTAQALTGRLHVMTICPLSQGEIGGTTEDHPGPFVRGNAATATTGSGGSTGARRER